MKPVVYHCEADVELVGAAKSYKCHHERLGHVFLHAVHAALAKIQDDPERFPFHEKPTRACRVIGFPYRLVYEVCRTPFTSSPSRIRAASRATGQID